MRHLLWKELVDRSESIQAGPILHRVRRNRLWHGPDSLRGSGVSICFNPASLRALGESACSRGPVALAHFDITLGRSDIASTQTDIEMTISNSLWSQSTAAIPDSRYHFKSKRYH